MYQLFCEFSVTLNDEFKIFNEIQTFIYVYSNPSYLGLIFEKQTRHRNDNENDTKTYKQEREGAINFLIFYYLCTVINVY